MLSPEILTANIAAITQTQGQCPALGALPDFVRAAVAGNGVQIERQTTDGSWRRVDSPSTTAGARSWLASGTSPGAAQLVVVGAGLGYALDAAAKLNIRRIVAIEPHPGVATLLLSRRDWRAWITGGRLRLLTGPDYAGAADLARFINGLEDISIVVHPERAAAEPQVIAHAEAVATRIVQNARANGNARRRFAGPYLLQTLANLEAIGREADVQALTGRFAGVPAVVVGAGPSLDDNVKALAPLADRAVIVTADTALRPLLLNGVRPHIAVGVDSSAVNAQHLTAAGAAADVALAGEGSLAPSAFDAFSGRTFTFRVAGHEPWPWLGAAGVTRGEVKTWGSVLTSAFNLARQMGCDPIVFVGADLAFTGMRPYCRGTIYDARWQEWIDKGCTWEALMDDYFSRQPDLRRPDVHGEPVRTAPHLLSFRDWLVEQTTIATGGVFVNATGAGILHGGRLQQAALGDVLARAPRVSGLHAAVQSCHRQFVDRSDDARRIASLLGLARREPGQLPIERWVEFAASAVTRDQIAAALGVAL